MYTEFIYLKKTSYLPTRYHINLTFYDCEGRNVTFRKNVENGDEAAQQVNPTTKEIKKQRVTFSIMNAA